jgi:hypothetical protein
VVRLKADPGLIRIFGKADKSAAEPGYASEPIDFLEAREQLDWSLCLVWNIRGSKGETPIIPLRYLNYMDNARVGGGRFDIESVTHVLTGRRWKERILPAKCDVRLYPSVADKSEIPAGKNLIVVAALGQVLHFLMFDGDGKLAVDTDERKLQEHSRQIEDLRKQLVNLWPPHPLSESEKNLLSTAVSAIVRHTIPVPAVRAGRAFIHRNDRALSRVRLAGRPIYANDQNEAIAAIERLSETDQLRDYLIVEDPTRPLPVDFEVTGSATIVEDFPEQLVVETDARVPAYLVVSDSFDPGWSATVDDQPGAIHPAYCAFRAVFLPPGKHSVKFQYSPAGFKLGLVISLCGMLAGLVLWFLPGLATSLVDEHNRFDGPPYFRIWYLAALVAIVLVSIPGIGPDGRITTQSRWTKSFHRFTWGSGIEAMQPRRERTREARPSADQPLDGMRNE